MIWRFNQDSQAALVSFTFLGVSFIKSLGTDSHWDLGLLACVAGANSLLSMGFFSNSLLSEVSHFLLGTPAINRSWVRARYVLFSRQKPKASSETLYYQHGTLQSVLVHQHTYWYTDTGRGWSSVRYVLWELVAKPKQC